MSQQINEIYEFGSFRLDRQERLLLRAGESVSLTPKAFDLLLALLERAGRLVEKEELFQTVWPDTIVEESNLSSNIALIRKALGDGENGLKFIETVPKRGYRFVTEVRAANDERSPQVEFDAEPLAVIAVPSSRAYFRTRPMIFLALGIIGPLIGVAVWWLAFRRSPQLPPPQIAPFTSFVGKEMPPSFSPDGNQIAFTWDGEQADNTDIYVKQIGNESMLRLTTDPATEHWPRWSPDGRQVVFDSRAGGSADIYVISADGGQPRRLTTEPSADIVPSWSHDGNWIYFYSDRSGNQQVWKMPATGGPATQVTKQGGFESVEAPDGQWLYYAKARFAPGIWRVPIGNNAAGGEETLVLDQHRAGELRYWTVTAQGIYFAALIEKLANPRIEFFDFATGKVTTVLALEKSVWKQASGLSVSPDGRWLTWSQIDQVSSDIMLMDNVRLGQ